ESLLEIPKRSNAAPPVPGDRFEEAGAIKINGRRCQDRDAVVDAQADVAQGAGQLEYVHYGEASLRVAHVDEHVVLRGSPASRGNFLEHLLTGGQVGRARDVGSHEVLYGNDSDVVSHAPPPRMFPPFRASFLAIARLLQAHQDLLPRAPLAVMHE